MFGGKRQSFWTLSFLNWQRAKVLLKLEFDTEDHVISYIWSRIATFSQNLLSCFEWSLLTPLFSQTLLSCMVLVILFPKCCMNNLTGKVWKFSITLPLFYLLSCNLPRQLISKTLNNLILATFCLSLTRYLHKHSALQSVAVQVVIWQWW